MDAPDHLTPQEALICAMLLMAARDGAVGDAELGQMTRLVQDLPAFADLSPEEVARSTEACLPLLEGEERLCRALELMREALPPRLRETAYLLACEVAAADGEAEAEELLRLQQLRLGLELDRLVAGAMERAARARYQVI